MSYQGAFCWTLEQASKAVVNNKRCLDVGEYWTTVKGEPCNPEVPEECWAITNHFDPKVREEDANTRP
jgi:hypothetical protein